jgi:hypothetical protein
MTPNMSIHKVWQTREKAITYLEREYPSRLAVAYKTLELFDLCTEAFNQTVENDDYARACGVTLLKARNLAIGSFGMILDGLGQEAGALMRPMIECAEILAYLRLKPDEAGKALSDQLPKAGDRAKAIGSIYEEFRKHLNQYASHNSFSEIAVRHLIDVSNNKLLLRRELCTKALDKNLRDFVVQCHLLLFQAAQAIEILGEETFLPIAINWERLKNRTLDVYELN